MNSILILVGIVLAGIGILVYLMKSGKVEDKNGNLVPDQVEDVVERVTKAVERPLPNRRKRPTVTESVQETLPDLTTYTKDQLVTYARENNIKVSSRARKVDILDTILSSDTSHNNN